MTFFTSRCQIGLDFFEFLNETNRTSINDRIQLRDIYNAEFRNRWASIDPLIVVVVVVVSENFVSKAKNCPVLLAGLPGLKIQTSVPFFMPWKRAGKWPDAKTRYTSPPRYEFASFQNERCFLSWERSRDITVSVYAISLYCQIHDNAKMNSILYCSFEEIFK